MVKIMKKDFYQVIKRTADLAIASSSLILLAPFLFVVALVIRLSSPGPAFFTQERVGRGGTLFRLLKFRTMVMEKTGDPDYFITAKDERIPPVGRFLRRWSIDEPPQLLNILKGEMTLVGPRPTLPYQVACYTDRQRKRLLVKPGLTGWAQINGRNAITWPERIEHDLFYVENASLSFDLKIVLKTPLAMLRAGGIYGKKDPIVMGRGGDMSFEEKVGI